MGRILIELLSDSCISSGEVYNSSIDSDVCYDSYGFPYIPAKRLRGCLRESALELKDFGVKAGINNDIDIDIDALFGKSGNSSAAFTIGNAKLKEYDSYLSQIRNCTRNEYTYQQTVLDQFTYVRYQTRIEQKSGTADDTSLRAVRVIKKGLVFAANIDVQSKFNDIIELCCKNLRFMGMNRTRGMGEVRVTYDREYEQLNRKKNVEWNDTKDYRKMSYSVVLKSPMLIKSVAGGQTKTIRYIDGAKILGMIAQNLGNSHFLKFMNEEQSVVCSNAYISDGKKRYTPISASLYGIKNDKKHIRDKAFWDSAKKGDSEGKQLVQLSDIYIDNNTKEIKKMTVNTEIHYHHSRPLDKSVGHVIGNDANSQEAGSFYQMESISEKQIFMGYILASKEQLRTIYDIITENPIQHIGYGKSSEYGEAEFVVTSLECQEKQKKEYKGFVIKLNAPAILYNENGMYSSKEEVLCKYIEEELQQRQIIAFGQKLVIENRFLKYTRVGGFNTTWGLHKPVITAFDAGTTLVLKVQKENGEDLEEVIMLPEENIFIGERISEGYGEIEFYGIPSDYKKRIDEAEYYIEEMTDTDKNDLIRDIATRQAVEEIKRQARQDAIEVKEKKKKNESMNAVNGNLILMCRQQENFEDFLKNIESRFNRNTEQKQGKREIAYKIIPKNLDMKKIQKDVCDKYPEAVLDINMVYKIYVMTLLTTIKYLIREEMQ